MINVVADITVADGRGQDLERLFADTRPRVVANPACLRYDLQRLRRSETEYTVLECWESTAALKEHGASEAFARFGAELAGLVAGNPDVRVYEPVGDQVGLEGA